MKCENVLSYSKLFSMFLQNKYTSFFFKYIFVFVSNLKIVKQSTCSVLSSSILTAQNNVFSRLSCCSVLLRTVFCFYCSVGYFYIFGKLIGPMFIIFNMEIPKYRQLCSNNLFIRFMRQISQNA